MFKSLVFETGPSSKDLSRMFPTPPSADNPLSEPMQDADFFNDTPLLLSSADHSNHQFIYNNSCLLPKEEVVKHSVTSGTVIHKVKLTLDIQIANILQIIVVRYLTN